MHTAVVDCPPKVCPVEFVQLSLIQFVQKVGLGRIVFTAKRRIRAYTPLTIDYNPEAANDKHNKADDAEWTHEGARRRRYRNPSGREKVTKSTMECRCGSDNCRGYIFKDSSADWR